MRRYAQVSGTFMSLLALAHVARLVFGWPIRVAGVDVPVWVSIIPVIVVGGLAVWALRVAGTSSESP